MQAGHRLCSQRSIHVPGQLYTAIIRFIDSDACATLTKPYFVEPEL